MPSTSPRSTSEPVTSSVSADPPGSHDPGIRDASGAASGPALDTGWLEETWLLRGSRS